MKPRRGPGGSWFYRQPGVRYCKCFGILDYIYAYFWRCRDCGRWWEV